MIPPAIPPIKKAAPTATPCSSPSCETSLCGGVMSCTADWQIGSMHDVAPSTARPATSSGTERESAAVPQPMEIPAHARSCSGLRPTTSETAPQSGSKQNVMSWSTDSSVPLRSTPPGETLVEPSALAIELQSPGIAGAVNATLRK